MAKISIPGEALEQRSGDRPDVEGTRALLRTGTGTLAAGVVAAALAETVFGGIGPQGPHTNSGWLALMVALMSLPFGLMLFVLGGAKWLRNRRLRREPSN